MGILSTWGQRRKVGEMWREKTRGGWDSANGAEDGRAGIQRTPEGEGCGSRGEERWADYRRFLVTSLGSASQGRVEQEPG